MSEWLEDTPEELEEVEQEASGALARAGVGSTENVVEQKTLPMGKKNRKIFRPLSQKWGEAFRHWYTLPDGSRTADNCACSPKNRANRLSLCPVCQYMEAGYGNPGKGMGFDNTAHAYYLLGLFGDIVTVHVRDEHGKLVPSDEGISWDYMPKIFKVTGSIYNEIWKWRKNPDYPPGAEGDIRNVNWAVWREQGTNRIFYCAEYHSVGPRPDTGVNENNEEVEIDYGISQILKEQILNEIRPSNPEELARKLEQGMPEEEAPPQRPIRQAAAPATRPAPKQTAPPQEQSQDEAPLSNDFEVEDEASPTPPPAAQPARKQPGPAVRKPAAAPGAVKPGDRF